MNQVWIALIAYCLLTLVKQETNVKHSLLEISRMLKLIFAHCRGLFYEPCYVACCPYFEGGVLWRPPILKHISVLINQALFLYQINYCTETSSI